MMHLINYFDKMRLTARNISQHRGHELSRHSGITFQDTHIRVWMWYDRLPFCIILILAVFHTAGDSPSNRLYWTLQIEEIMVPFFCKCSSTCFNKSECDNNLGSYVFYYDIMVWWEIIAVPKSLSTIQREIPPIDFGKNLRVLVSAP